MQVGAAFPGEDTANAKACGVDSAGPTQGGACTGRARAGGSAGAQPAAQLGPWPSPHKTRLCPRPRGLTSFLRVKGRRLPEGSLRGCEGKERNAGGLGDSEGAIARIQANVTETSPEANACRREGAEPPRAL